MKSFFFNYVHKKLRFSWSFDSTQDHHQRFFIKDLISI